MFIDRGEHKFIWDGDVKSLTPGQATKLMEQLAQLAFPDDPPEVALQKAAEASDKEIVQ